MRHVSCVKEEEEEEEDCVCSVDEDFRHEACDGRDAIVAAGRVDERKTRDGYYGITIPILIPRQMFRYYS